MEIQVYSRETTWRGLQEATPALRVGRLPVARVKQAYTADPQGFSRRYLSEEEAAALAAWRFPKKKWEWLAGRVVLKRLYRRMPESGAEKVNPSQVIIARKEEGPQRGQPYLVRRDYPGLMPKISLSHGGPWALAVMSFAGQVGIDVEKVEPVDRSFIHTVYTSEEIEILHNLPSPMKMDQRVRWLWTLKEAMLKALGTGFYYGLGSLRLHAMGEQGPVIRLAPELATLSLGKAEMYYGLLAGHCFCVIFIDLSPEGKE